MFSINNYKSGFILNRNNIGYLNLFYHPKTSPYYRKFYTEEIFKSPNIQGWINRPNQTRENAELVSDLISAFEIPEKIRTVRIWSAVVHEFPRGLQYVPLELLNGVLESVKTDEQVAHYCSVVCGNCWYSNSEIIRALKFFEKQNTFGYYLNLFRSKLALVL